MPASRFVLSLVLVLIPLFQDSAESYKRGIPKSFTKKLQPGKDFCYVCCAKRNGTIWFRWGLYLQGSHRDPVTLFSRALIKDANTLDNTWSRNFNKSRYTNRVKVTYNYKSLCMVWKILRVRRGDDNTFFGVYRDEPGLGKQFKPCATAMKLVVIETVSSLSTSSTPTPLKSHTQLTTEESHVTTKIITDDDMEDTSDPSETSAEEEPNHLLDWAIPCALVALFLLLVGIAGFCRYKIRQWIRTAVNKTFDFGANVLFNKIEP